MRLGLVPFILIFTAASALAQQPGVYNRKSISYVDALWLATPSARQMKPTQVATVLDEVKKAIEMPRFDFNPLPEPLLREFAGAANARNSLTVDEIAALMQAKLTPAITGILEAQMEVRAKELVSEADRAGFLATKAKEHGITLEQIEKVMNAAYIYLPVLTAVKREEGKVKDRYIYTLEGGIIWFHIVMEGDKPKVVLLKALSTSSMGFGSDAFAYESAVENFARNLQTATRDLPDFKLGAQISEVEGSRVRFRLGAKEGVRLDETYLVGEWMETSGGGTEFQRKGWVKVVKVAQTDSPADASSAIAIKRDVWAPGMTLVEHPRLGIDLSPKPGLFHTRISQGRIPLVGTLFGGEYLYIDEDFDQYVLGVDLDAHIGIANLTGRVGSRFLVGVNFAFPDLEFTLPGGALTLLTTSPPFVWGVHGGYMRKFYFGRLNLTAEALFGGQFFTVEQSIERNNNEYSFTIRNNSIGGQAALGLDWAASPDFNIGAMAGWRFFTVADAWTVEANIDGEVYAVDFSGDGTLPAVNHSGLMFVLYMHWSVPSLPFDPVRFIQGTVLNQ